MTFLFLFFLKSSSFLLFFSFFFGFFFVLPFFLFFLLKKIFFFVLLDWNFVLLEEEKPTYVAPQHPSAPFQVLREALEEPRTAGVAERSIGRAAASGGIDPVGGWH